MLYNRLCPHHILSISWVAHAKPSIERLEIVILNLYGLNNLCYSFQRLAITGSTSPTICTRYNLYNLQRMNSRVLYTALMHNTVLNAVI
jgi:hypothetical protein